VVHRAAVAEGETAGAVEQPAGRHRDLDRGALRRPPVPAEFTPPAPRPPHQHDGIARCHAADVRAGTLDHPSALVAQDGRQPTGEIPGQIVQVAVADSGGLDPDQYFPGARLG
jgi:hypothetical protein